MQKSYQANAPRQTKMDIQTTIEKKQRRHNSTYPKLASEYKLCFIFLKVAFGSFVLKHNECYLYLVKFVGADKLKLLNANFRVAANR
jgi:hypothetical protein